MIDVAKVEVATPSIYSGFDEDDHFRGQDFIDQILGQELFFGDDYIENQDTQYALTEGYETYCIPLPSEETMIGCTSAGSLEITGDYYSVVYFALKQDGKKDFTTLDRLYLKDVNTMYASVNGYLTFKLERISESFPY